VEIVIGGGGHSVGDVDGLPIAIDRHESPAYTWLIARRAPHAGLAGVVDGYCGYTERSFRPMRRRQVATGGVTLIVSFGDPIAVQLSTAPTATRVTSFVAGLHDGWVVTEYAGPQAGVQIDLSPLGAYRLLGVPASEIANGVVDIGAFEHRWLAELPERLAAAPDWSARFATLDSELARRAADGPDIDRSVAWAWSQLAGSHGRVPVATLADEIGWSRRHFAVKFRELIGLAPKSTGRVLRFSHAVGLLGNRDAGSIGDVAAMCGYADHSHLVRDFRDLAGCTPTALVASQLPDGGGVAA
jgi:AraC-like DNA-binding protein